MHRPALIWLAVFSMISLINCSQADTLGSVPPVEVVVTGSPSWSKGMQELLALKCAPCHAHPLPDIAPDGIVADLDLTRFETYLVDGVPIRGADALGPWIKEGLLDDSVNAFTYSQSGQMPLNYATPLTDKEKDLLQAWAATGCPKDEQPQPPLGDAYRGHSFYFNSGCVTCHALGEGVRQDGAWLGPPISRTATTVEKIKSMWLHKCIDDTLTTEEASDIRAYIFELLDDLN